MGRPCPVRFLRPTTADSSGGSSQRSSGWVVGIVRYAQPAAMADDPDKFPTIMNVIQNDAVAVSINNSKKSFGKICNISLKSTDFWYPGFVSPGDWVFVWMHNNEEELERITHAVNKVKDGGGVGNTLCNATSGLKFAGRIISVTHSDVVSPNGSRVINQNIAAQAFLEFATSVYYTTTAHSAVQSLATSPGGDPLLTKGQASALQTQFGNNAELLQFAGLNEQLKDLATKYRDLYRKGNSELTPDIVITLFFIVVMGIDKDKSDYIKNLGIKGTYNNGIHVPKQVARIFGFPSDQATQRIWELMSVYLGIQDYKQKGGAWYNSWSPSVDSVDEGVFKKTPIRCKGFVPFTAALWDNVSMWDILNQYLNPVSNEMYTALKINSNGKIQPTLTIREKPFSTGLPKILQENGSAKPGHTIANLAKLEGEANLKEEEKIEKEDFQTMLTGGGLFGGPAGGASSAGQQLAESLIGPTKQAANAQIAAVISASQKARTMYSTLPRWVVSEGIVRSFSYRSNESARVNFVQVWGRNASALHNGLKFSHTEFLQSQFVNGNLYFDQNDISRNGLRAYIVTSPYDTYFTNQNKAEFAKIWARLNADWLFNGHLKVSGSLVVDGIVDPVAEGENLEYRNILFHIENVSHSAQIAADGKRVWTTTFSLSNGVLASSLNNPDSVPKYVANRPSFRQSFKNPLVPGLTEAQRRIGDKSKNELGDDENNIAGWKDSTY